MLSQDNDTERLSKECFALTEISKTLIFQLEFSERLGPVIKKIVGLVKEANIDSTMFWDQSAGVFRA